MLVVAGPGSGKTTVITHRILNLIRQENILPGNLLVITYTRAAANEMKERFLSLYGRPVSEVTFGTFHSIFLKILHYAYRHQFESVIGEKMQLNVIQESCRKHGFKMPYQDPFYLQVLSGISRVKNGLSEIEEAAPPECGADVFSAVLNDYQNYLTEHRYLDFDDIQIYCRDLLLNRPDILKAWHDKYRYILVDEFQDCSPLQYDLLRLLAAPENHLFLVGDDDQSIYSFRGGTPMLMQQFLKDYPDAQQVTLGTNYRCHPAIIRSANRLIENNRYRLPKKEAVAAGVHDRSARAVFFHSFHDQRSEMMFILTQIRDLISDGKDYQDIAVLMRTNAQLSAFLSFADAYQIPVVCKDYMPNQYRVWAVEDILTYLKVAAGDRSREKLIRIMNRPSRYLSRANLPAGPVSFETWAQNYPDQDWIRKRILKLEDDLTVLSKMRPYAAVIYILKAVGYEEWMREYAKTHGICQESLDEAVAMLTDEAKGYDTIREWLNAIEAYHERYDQKMKTVSDTDANGVCFMTYHSAKGLEYPVVFLPDLCEGIIPYHRAVLPEEVEEERRMLYVAMTRAKERLYLMTAEEIRSHKREPSVFLYEILEEL